MRSAPTRLSLAGLSLLVCIVAWGQSPHFDPTKMMRADEVRRGMKGVGKSVFSGVEIEEFNLEILGVLSKANLGGDLVLARVTSGPVVARDSGIIGGMSGSPVYIDGKLLGAIAYGWSFSREPITGITAIESMLDAYDPGVEGQAQLPPGHPARGAQVSGHWVEQARIVTAERASTPFAADDTINIVPVGPLVYASGIKGPGMDRLKGLFGPYGIEPLAGPGRKRPPVPTELEPGAAVGVSFVTGTFDIDGIGTVTYRDGDTILAFGHPMMELGSVQIPLTTAWVHDFIPSMSFSNKLASSMETAGVLTRDGTWSVGGTVGEKPPTIPARFTVTDQDRDLTREFQFEVARQQMLTPSLLMSVLEGSMSAAYNSGGRGIGTVDFVLRGERGAEISRRDVLWHPGNVAYVTQWIQEAMYIMTENRFEPQQVASLEARVGLTGKDRSAAIERIYTDENVARAGKQLTVHVVMRPENQKPVEKVVKLALPASLPKGEIRVGAAAGPDEWSLRSRLRLLFPQYYSLDDMARIIESFKRSDQLYVAAGLPNVTLSVQGTALPQFPTESAQVLAASGRTDLTVGYRELSETLDTEWVLYGWDYIRLPTEDRMGERGKVSREEGGGESNQAAAAGPEGLPQRLWWMASAFDRDLKPADTPGMPGEVARDAEPGPEPPPEEEGGPEETRTKEEKEEDTGEHPGPDGEALSRQLSTWTQDTQEHFAKGKAEGVLVRSDGALLLAPGAQVLAEADEPYIWSVVAAGDAVYYGTASPGRIYRYTQADGARLAYDTGEFAVLSLMACEDGSILAGTGPNGRILRVTADGKTEEAYRLPVTYVWALGRTPAGEPVAGTGPAGQLFRLKDAGEFSVLATVSQPHVLDLAVAGNSLYAAGGDEEGAVYRISQDGTAVDVLGTDEESCTGLAADDQGRLYVSTASDGKIFVIGPGGRATQVYESDDGDLLDILLVDGRAYAASTDDARIIAADVEERSGVAHKDELAAQVVCLAGGNDGMVYAGTANPGRLIRLDLRGEISGQYDSAVLDAERFSRWARISWDAEVPEGAALEVLTRSGNSEVAEDGSWGPWSPPYPESGSPILSLATRYLQYRLKMTGRDSKSPLLHRVAVLYLTGNQKPTLEIDDPDQGEAIRAEYEISWTAKDEDDDTLLTTIYVRRRGADEWKEIAKVTDEESYTWDTTRGEDGEYALRLVATDAPSNPMDAESVEKIVYTITVDQGYPELILFGRPEVKEKKSATIKGAARDEGSRITSIDWSFAAGSDWQTVAPDDGLLDSRQEVFSIRADPIPEGETALKIRVRDAAGNVTIETVSLTDEPRERTRPGSRPEGDAQG